MRHGGQVLSRQQFLCHWDYDFEHGLHVVDVYVRHSATKWITREDRPDQTVRGSVTDSIPHLTPRPRSFYGNYRANSEGKNFISVSSPFHVGVYNPDKDCGR